jgi:protein-disulfide isomerase
MTKEAKILIAIAGVVIIGGVLLAIFANPQPKDPGAPVDGQSLVRDSSHMTGQLGAKVTIVEFGDFQCPACRSAHPVVKQVLEAYKDNPNVNFVFRNLPLDAIHPNAHVSAEAAEAAGAQGKFWEMVNILFERQDEWANQPDPFELFVSYAQNIGVGNIDEFKTQVSQRQYAAVIKADQDDAAAVGATSTPTFFINGVKQEGGMNFDDWKAKIDAELAK